ncbi:GNAT family N-acetyltransferase [Acuticoccus sp. M5D2P5]|uniref:GNAT family N-acetyltransferase n=1 Tax=Acuticoccus kalidii TaxID=2910977 RepID=UPI001F3B1CCF|nr:N-acetyltransferase [Acuticoccus kalidii]MCF3932658.1 GNAT family N-acetyltransferase [Acuticoccus kalidii]
MGRTLTIDRLDGEAIRAEIDALSALLADVVAAGASINFVLPFTPADAERFWRDKVLPRVESGGITMLVARHEGWIVGSVQLVHDTPPNQPHRADIAKLMVHPDARRMGIAKRLMVEAERRAAPLGRTLITLDTRTGDAAEPLYTALGYQTVGVIPGYARDPYGTDRLDSTTIMYKTL